MRVLNKSLVLKNDCTVIDLEDAISPSKKEEARSGVMEFLRSQEMENKEDWKTVLLRVNCPISTPWGKDDLSAVEDFVQSGVPGLSGVVLPKVESKEVIQDLNGFPLPIWAMIETPRGVINVESITGDSGDQLEGIIFGLNDFTKEIDARHTPQREPLMYAMSRCIIAARASDKVVIDGVHMEIEDLAGLEWTSRQGRNLGFDGRSIIHPTHIELTNAMYSPSPEEVEHARKLVEKYALAESEGKGVTVVDDMLIEKLHVEAAQKVLEKAKYMDAGRV
jgi:citrate lyase subunit beta / citryl-CoA lyase